MLPPSREGPLEFFEEKQRVRWFESIAVTFETRWVVLKDCVLAVYEDEEVALLNDQSESMLSIQLNGCICQRHSSFERTLVLENSAISTLLGTHRKILLRAETENEIGTWWQLINESSLWDVALRAAASLPAAKKKKKKVKHRDKTSHNQTWETNSDTNTISETPCTPESRKLDDFDDINSNLTLKSTLSVEKASPSQTLDATRDRSQRSEDVRASNCNASPAAACQTAAAASRMPIVASCTPAASSFVSSAEDEEKQGFATPGLLSSQGRKKEFPVPNLMAWKLPLTVAAANDSQDAAASIKLSKGICHEPFDQNPIIAEAPAAASPRESPVKQTKGVLYPIDSLDEIQPEVNLHVEASAQRQGEDEEEEEEEQQETDSSVSEFQQSEPSSDEDSHWSSEPSTASSDIDTSDEEKNERSRAEFMR